MEFIWSPIEIRLKNFLHSYSVTYFVVWGHTGSGGGAVVRRGRNGRIGQIGAGWWWGSQGVGLKKDTNSKKLELCFEFYFVDSALNESLILHPMFVMRRTDQHR